MKIIQIINAKRAFSNYLDAKMPPAVAYKIMKLVRSAETEEAFYQKEIQLHFHHQQQQKLKLNDQYHNLPS